MAQWPRFPVTLSQRAREFLDYVRNARDSSASEAINYLLLKDKPRESMLREVDGFRVLYCEDDGLPITLEDIEICEQEEYIYPGETQKPTPRRTSIRISPEALAIVERSRQAGGMSKGEAICKKIEDAR